jgi:hypothetical protein
LRLASFVAGGRERWGFVVDDPTTGASWVVEPGRAEAVLAAYASIPSSGLVATRPHIFENDSFENDSLENDSLGNNRLRDDNPNTRIVNLFPLGHQRPQGAAIGPGAPVTFKNGNHLPLMAYNVELAVVIGKAGRYIPLDRAMDHVAGYTVVNDVSGTYYYGIVPGNAGRGYSLPERYGDWLYQATASWGGRKADTLAPMGPYLVTKDEIGDPYDLLMYTRQSGRTLQGAG